ncbi:MAG: helix-turn-helix domain-containing protein [Anaeromyxobacteraceae bacterium]
MTRALVLAAWVAWAAAPLPDPLPAARAEGEQPAPFTPSEAEPEAERSRRAPVPVILSGAPAESKGERAAALFTTGTLPLDLSALERLAIGEALRRVAGNRTHAARLLGIGLRTLRNKLRTYREAGVEVEAAEAAARLPLPLAPADAEAKPAALLAALRARVSQEDRS